jgi:threonine/homoserine/homoserine lactone efflux protein
MRACETEMARALALGLVVGFVIAASPGPIFFLVLRRTLARGWRSGLVSGLGIATGDAIYAALAAFGVAVITTFLMSQRRWIGFVGGIALMLIGVQTILRPPQPSAPRPDGAATATRGVRGSSADYASMVALTLSNPATILSFTAVFAGLGLRVDPGWPSSLGLVVAVMLGSAAWWILLAGLISSVRERLTPGMTRAISLGSGVALIGFGAWTAARALSSS